MRTVALYAGFLGLMLIVLSMRVSLARRDAQVSTGDGGNDVLHRWIRAHGNFVEFVPFAVLLLALSEHLNLGALFIHLFGLLLILARIAHAYALVQTDGVTAARGFGALGTLAVIAITSIYCIIAFF